MGLSGATPPRPLPPGPPYPCAAFSMWKGAAWDFDLPPGDPRLRALYQGHRETVPSHAYLAGATMAWAQYPDHMDFLAEDSPIREQKRLELAIYLDRWERCIPAGCRV